METQYIVFENYLTGNLPEEEITLFEKKLQNDASFKRDFIAYKSTFSFLENKFNNNQKTQEFKENLQKISDNHFKTSKKRQFSLFKYGAVASILLLVGFFIFNNSSPTYNDFVTYPSLELTVRGSQNELLNNAEKTFNNKKFKEANSYFALLLKDDPKNTLFKLYKGFSLIELEKFEEAENILKEVSKGNSAYKYKAIWYIALSKLKQKDFSGCKTILKEIPKGSTEYKKALQLIDDL